MAKNSSKFISIARKYNSKSVVLSCKWAKTVVSKAQKYGYEIMLHTSHKGYKHHIHLIGNKGKLANLHLQISKRTWNILRKMIK